MAPQDRLTGTNRDAFAALNAMFTSYGLGTLANKIVEYLQDGMDANAISLQLQESPEYKARFIGNEERKKAGLSVLSPAEYLATEEAYKATLKAYNMPTGFYDSPDDFAKLMGQDISPDEVKTRAQAAWSFTETQNGANRKMLRDYYGVDDSYVAAYFLDPQRGQAVIERQAAAAGYGGIAARQNLGVSRQKAEDWYDQGISADAVASGVQNAASVYTELDTIGNRYGEDYTQDDATDEFVGGLASARRKRERLARREGATFGGATGTATFGGADAGSF